MQIVNIALSEYTQYSENPVYGIQNLYWPIYCFYKDHSQQAHYHFVYDKSTDLQRIIDYNSINFYATYGLDFRDNAEFHVNTRRFVAYIDASALLDDTDYEHLKNTYSEIDKEDIGLVFIEFGKNDINNVEWDDKITLSARVHDLYPNAFIANAGINVLDSVTISKKPVFKNTVRFDDISSHESIFENINSMNRNTVILTAMLRMIDLISKTKADMIDVSESAIADKFSYGNRVAIIYICLIKYSKLVYFDRYSASVIHDMHRRMMHPSAMYADDYLMMLANLPDVAVYDVIEPVLVFPDKNRDKYTDIRIHVLTCEIDLDTKQLAPDVAPAVYYYPDIKIYSAAQMFHLASKDTKEAMKGAAELKDLYKQLSSRCMTEIDTSDVIMYISNTIFYHLDGKDYMAYITNLVTDIQFVAYPIRPQSTSFTMKLNLIKDTLYDIRMYDDWRETIIPYYKAGFIDKKNMFFRPVRYLNGLCLNSLFSDAAALDSDIGLTYEEVGMFSNATWSLRNSKKILDYVKHDCVIDKMTTVFGGLHPMQGTKMIIQREDWRSKRDKLQKQNTYGY